MRTPPPKIAVKKIDGQELPYPLTEWQFNLVVEESMLRQRDGNAISWPDLARELAVRFQMADFKASAVLGSLHRGIDFTLGRLQGMLDAGEIDALALVAIIETASERATQHRQATAARSKSARAIAWVQDQWDRRSAGQYSKRMAFGEEMAAAVRGRFAGVKVSPEQIANDWVKGRAAAAGRRSTK